MSCLSCHGKKYFFIYLYNEKDLSEIRLSDNSSKQVKLVETYSDKLQDETCIEYKNVICIQTLSLLNQVISENYTNIDELKEKFLKIRLTLLNPMFTYAKRCSC